MHPIRNALFRVVIAGALLSPVFAFAQLGTSTRPSQSSLAQQQLQQLLQSRTQDTPTAADINNAALVDYLKVSVSPQDPKPGDSVRVSITSYLTDLQKATVSWTLNGNTVLSGTGKTTFSFKNGTSGSTTYLTITITANTGETFEKRLSWSPVGVVILWEAATYTPPFYRGKALPVSQAQVRAVAIPDISTGLGAGNYTYVWEKDGTTVSAASGFRKNSFSFAAPIPFGKSNVRVLVSSLDDTYSSATQVNLPLVNPFIVFYEKLPLVGTWYNSAIQQSTTLAKKEMTVVAEPYFFSLENSDTPSLSYSWYVNGSRAQNQDRGITLRNDTGSRGASSVSLSIGNSRHTFQSASGQFNVVLQGDSGNNTFF